LLRSDMIVHIENSKELTKIWWLVCGRDVLNVILKYDPWKKERKIPISLKLKILFCKRHCQENEKAAHRLGENICKDTVIQNRQSTSKLNSEKSNNPTKKIWTDTSPKTKTQTANKHREAPSPHMSSGIAN
jgi:replication initiation and membrane attachment protein DnaB